MKPLYLILAAVLSACSSVPPRQESQLIPLSSVAPRIKEGMSIAEVSQALSGHRPALQFTDKDASIWEVQERINYDKNNAMDANRLVVVFDKLGKVAQAQSSFCFLPDQEPSLGNAPATRCYQKHLFFFDKKLTYNAIKRLLIISNYQVDHSDAASELISATGTHGIEGDDDKMMFIKLSIIFSPQDNDATEVVMSASFSTSEKQSTWVQAGFAGVTLPVPLPFQKTEEWVDTGIVTPRFYLKFYDALSNLIAKEYRPYTPVTATGGGGQGKPPMLREKAGAGSAKSTPVAPIPSAPRPAGFPSVQSNEHDLLLNLDGPIDAERSTVDKPANQPDGNNHDPLLDLKGPIDAEPSKKGPAKKTIAREPAEADADEDDGDADFSDLNGKPIDSESLKNR